MPRDRPGGHAGRGGGHADSFVQDAAGYLVAAGGNRLRPTLVLIAGHTGDPGEPRLVGAAVAIELTHLSSLYHDDVMDEAELRRDLPSANARYDNTERPAGPTQASNRRLPADLWATAEGFVQGLGRRFLRYGVAVPTPADWADWGRLPASRRSRMGVGGFRDKADDALNQAEQEVDERTGDRFDEQTDRGADEVRERGEGVFGDQQQGDEPQQ